MERVKKDTMVCIRIHTLTVGTRSRSYFPLAFLLLSLKGAFNYLSWKHIIFSYKSIRAQICGILSTVQMHTCTPQLEEKKTKHLALLQALKNHPYIKNAQLHSLIYSPISWNRKRRTEKQNKNEMAALQRLAWGEQSSVFNSANTSCIILGKS